MSLYKNFLLQREDFTKQQQVVLNEVTHKVRIYIEATGDAAAANAWTPSLDNLGTIRIQMKGKNTVDLDINRAFLLACAQNSANYPQVSTLAVTSTSVVWLMAFDLTVGRSEMGGYYGFPVGGMLTFIPGTFYSQYTDPVISVEATPGDVALTGDNIDWIQSSVSLSAGGSETMNLEASDELLITYSAEFDYIQMNMGGLFSNMRYQYPFVMLNPRHADLLTLESATANPFDQQQYTQRSLYDVTSMYWRLRGAEATKPLKLNFKAATSAVVFNVTQIQKRVTPIQQDQANYRHKLWQAPTLIDTRGNTVKSNDELM